MKISDFISGKFQTFGIQLSEADLLEISIKGGVDLDGQVSDMDSIYKAIAFFIPYLLLRPKSVSEGGVSISWDIDGLKDFYRYICKETGVEDKLSSSITDISDIW